MANKPSTVITKHLVRNVVIFLLFLIAAVGGFFGYQMFTKRKPAADTIATQSDTQTSDGEVAEELPQAESPSSLNVEEAKSAIEDYYTMLGQLNFAGLRTRGFDEAAGAIELGWVAQTGIVVVPDMIHPDVTAMPMPVSTYAGNDLYQIKDFFTQEPPKESVQSIVTGQTGPCGWIYHDALLGKWKIVDPVMPTGTQAPRASSESRVSDDRLVDVQLASPGIFRNAWWAVTMFSVDVTSASRTYDVTISERKGEERRFDDGVVVTIPESLLSGIHAANIPAVPIVNPDGTQSPQVAKAVGVVTMSRGTTHVEEFDYARIGQPPMRLDGDDMCPVEIETGAGEKISPVFPVDNVTASATASLLNEQDIKNFELAALAEAAKKQPAADQQTVEETQPVTSAEPIDGTDAGATDAEVTQ